MRTILYIIVVLFVLGWVFGFFVYHVGGLIHILLVVAVIALVLSLVRGSRSV